MLQIFDYNIAELISIFGSIIAVVIWFIRLESRSKNNHDEIRTIQIRLSSLEQTKLDLSERMARVETKLDLILDEIKKRV